MIKRNPQSPNVTLFAIRQHFFSQRLGSRVETAVVGTKRKIRSIRFRKTGAINPSSCKNTSARDVPPRYVCHLAGVGDLAWQDGIGHQAFRSMHLACIHVRFSCISSAIDQEVCSKLTDFLGKRCWVIEIAVGASQACVGQRSIFQLTNKFRTDITTRAQQNDHVKFLYFCFTSVSKALRSNGCNASTVTPPSFAF